MCGRYYVDEETTTEVEKLVREISERRAKSLRAYGQTERKWRYEVGSESYTSGQISAVQGAGVPGRIRSDGQIPGLDERAKRWLRKKDIHPSELAQVLICHPDEISGRVMRWGYPTGAMEKAASSGRISGQLLINARAETLFERPMFRESARYRRCVIPAGGYYEWNSGREKATLTSRDGTALYMAGIYNLYENEARFVVITTEANDSVRKIHHRMPLILSEDEVEDWLCDTVRAEKLLRKVPDALQASQEYEQLGLDLELDL